MSTPAPWHAEFPTPTSTPALVTAEELYALVKAQAVLSPPSPTYLVVDVRRTDFDIAFIPTAINLPAQSFYQTLPSLFPLLSKYPRVIFHCQSSNGRGPRVAAWFQDALDQAGVANDVSRAEVLVGGIKGWVEKHGGEENMVCWLSVSKYGDYFSRVDQPITSDDAAPIPRATLSSFPAEILLHIIEDVRKQDLKRRRRSRVKWESHGLSALRLTNKFFNSLATPILFGNAIIHDDEAQDHLVRCVLIPRFLSASASAGFGRYYPGADETDHMFSWDRGHLAVAQLLLLPNLRRLVLGENEDVQPFQLLGLVPTPAEALPNDQDSVSENTPELVGWSRATLRDVAGRVVTTLEMCLPEGDPGAVKATIKMFPNLEAFSLRLHRTTPTAIPRAVAGLRHLTSLNLEFDGPQIGPEWTTAGIEWTSPIKYIKATMRSSGADPGLFFQMVVTMFAPTIESLHLSISLSTFHLVPSKFTPLVPFPVLTNLTFFTSHLPTSTNFVHSLGSAPTLPPLSRLTLSGVSFRSESDLFDLVAALRPFSATLTYLTIDVVRMPSFNTGRLVIPTNLPSLLAARQTHLSALLSFHDRLADRLRATDDLRVLERLALAMRALTAAFRARVPPPASAPAKDVVVSMTDFCLRLLEDWPAPQYFKYEDEEELSYSFEDAKRQELWAIVDRADRRRMVLDRWRVVGVTLEWAEATVGALVDEEDFGGLVELTVAT